MALLAVVLIAVLVIGLQTLIGRRAADQMAAEIGAGLAEVAQQVADRALRHDYQPNRAAAIPKWNCNANARHGP